LHELHESKEPREPHEARKTAEPQGLPEHQHEWALAIVPRPLPFAGKDLRINATRSKKVELHEIQAGIADSRGAVTLRMAK
jgi:hypothetical protein